MRQLFRVAAAALAASLLLSSTPVHAAYYPVKNHAPVDYADMSWEEFDEIPLTQALDELEALIRGGSVRSRDRQTGLKAVRLYHQILNGYESLYTQYALAMIRYDSDYTDSGAANAYMDYSDRLTVLQDRCFTVLRLLARSPYCDILDLDSGAGWVESLRDYEPMTDEELELYRQETGLIADYEQLLNTDYDPQVMGELYLKLTRLRNDIARLYGYDSYADYAYSAVYGRDYTLQDIEDIQETVKSLFSELFFSIQDAMDDRFQTLYELEGDNAETRLDAIEPCIAGIHPELAEAFTFLREHHLYDLEESDTKLPMGYTAELPRYGSAFIFDAPYGDFSDYATVVHEFGHFNNSFHCTDRTLWAGNNMDVSEIHSQALELLFTEYADELFGDLGPAFRWYEVSYLLTSVLDGFMYNEFEAAVSRDPEMTVEEMGQLFLTIADSCGGGYEENDWMETTHLFQSPFYYISYGTSALSALDIWLSSLADREAGIDAYMTISALSTTVAYGEAVEQAGLRDIFDETALTALAGELDQVISDELGVKTGLSATGQPKMGLSAQEEQVFTLALIVCCVAAFLGSMVVLTLVLRRRKRRLEEDMGDLSRRRSTKYREDPWD